jgi:small-conductance mechanosensitive channel
MKTIWLSIVKPKPWVAKWLLLLGVVGFALLGYLGHLQPLKAFLDSDMFVFQMGELRFSVYLLLKAICIIIVLFWITSMVADFGERRIHGLQSIRASNRALMVKIFQIMVYFLAFMVALDVLGIDFTALAIFGGAVGIGVGFGLQKITSNFISGLILLFEKSIENDDLVELADGTYGFIRHTGARYTLIETFEGKEMMIPNEDFITNRVTNWTFSNTRGRIEISIGVSYDSDIEKAMELVLEAAKEHPRCVEDPAPVCFLRDFGDSSVNFLLFFWVADVTEGRFEPQSDVMRSIWKKFKAHNIAIPFPQRDVHIKQPLEASA